MARRAATGPIDGNRRAGNRREPGAGRGHDLRAAAAAAPRAAINGYAVRAAACVGASPYNPLDLALLAPGTTVLPDAAGCPIACGWTLPAGADAMLPRDAAEPDGTGRLAVLDAVPRGASIEIPTLVPGYGSMQGAVFRTDNPRFRRCRSVADVVAVASGGPDCLMVNRNAGSGTRVLIDRLLGDARPAGYMHQARSHNAVAAAAVQQRADWGLAIDTVARQYGLGFLPLQAEQYDFVVPRARRDRPPVQRFVALLESEAGRQMLRDLGFTPAERAVAQP